MLHILNKIVYAYLAQMQINAENRKINFNNNKLL